MKFNWNKKKRLKNAGITFTHHNELKNLIMIVEKLINHCEKTINARNKIYKIYFDNQALLKVVHVMSSMFNQEKLQKIQTTTNRIRNHDIHLKFHWIFDYADIENNEMINKTIEKVYNFTLFSFERFHHEVTTRVNFIRASSRKNWNKKWKEKTKKV